MVKLWLFFVPCRCPLVRTIFFAEFSGRTESHPIHARFIPEPRTLYTVSHLVIVPTTVKRVVPLVGFGVFGRRVPCLVCPAITRCRTACLLPQAHWKSSQSNITVSKLRIIPSNHTPNHTPNHTLESYHLFKLPGPTTGKNAHPHSGSDTTVAGRQHTDTWERKTPQNTRHHYRNMEHWHAGSQNLL